MEDIKINRVDRTCRTHFAKLKNVWIVVQTKEFLYVYKFIIKKEKEKKERDGNRKFKSLRTIGKKL